MKEEQVHKSGAETDRSVDRKVLRSENTTFFDEDKLHRIQSNFNKTNIPKTKNLHRKSNSTTQNNFHSTFLSNV